MTRHLQYNGARLRPRNQGWQVDLTIAHKRIRRTFPTLDQAKAFVDAQRGPILRADRPLDVKDATRAAALLPDDVSLTDTARFYLRHHPAAASASSSSGLQPPASSGTAPKERPSSSLSSAIAAFLEDKAHANLRPRSYRTLRIHLSALAADLGDLPLVDVRAGHLVDWLNAHDKQATTRANYRRNWATFFNWCIAVGRLTHNPAAAITKPRIDPAAPGILTPPQLRALLDAAQRHDPACIAPIALGAFAGLRSAEIARLTWAHLKWEAGDQNPPQPGHVSGPAPSRLQPPASYIHVNAHIAKTRVQRFTTINPTLHAWLMVAAPTLHAWLSSSSLHSADASAAARPPDSSLHSLPISPNDYRRRFERLRKTANIDPWPQNALRHSFATYHLALHHDAPRTAHELGQRNINVLYTHYRNLATESQAMDWFAVTPVTRKASRADETA